jgi:hypothetical protein
MPVVLTTSTVFFFKPVHDTIPLGLDDVTVGMGKDGKLDNARMLAILRKSGRFHSAPVAPSPPQSADFQVVFKKPGGPYDPWDKYADYLYDSTTGELGVEQEWCYVPDEFRRWMLRMKKTLRKNPNQNAAYTAHPVDSASVVTPDMALRNVPGRQTRR